MKRYLNRARPIAAMVVAIALCSTFVVPPAGAEPAPARPLAAAAAAAGEALPEAAVVQATKAAPTPAAPVAAVPAATADGKPFFKTTKGVLALVLTAGALGYMGYSFSNDRVKSPAR